MAKDNLLHNFQFSNKKNHSNGNKNYYKEQNLQCALLLSISEIVSSYISKNYIDTADLDPLIQEVHSSLSSAIQKKPKDTDCLNEEGSTRPTPSKPLPAVPINESIHHDYIVCLECKAKLKMAKGHLMARHNMTPTEYRQRWNLPEDYPIVSQNYSEIRTQLAKKNKLGRKKGA